MALEVTSLDKDYPTPSGPLSILRGVHLRLGPGEAVVVRGPSGPGKTPLLHARATPAPPPRGPARLDGVAPFALPEARLADFRNRRIGFVFQDQYLLPQCTVLENVLIPTLVAKDD